MEINFNGEVRQVNINETFERFHEAAKNESKTDSITIKLTPSQKIAIEAICEKRGIGKSTFFYQAIENHLRRLPYESKFRQYEKAFAAFIDNLP